jgi:3-oxoacyl-[acyl-carrier-protein] synthase-3
MLSIKIAGIGHYLPERIVSSAELEKEMRLAPGWAAAASGIQERRRAGGESSSQMAAAAANMALLHAGLAPADLDAIIGASSAPEQAIPCTASLVQQALGAPDGRSACFDVNATCLSFLVGLQVAAHFVAGGLYRRILIFSSEIANYSLDPHEPESAILIGDAAAAAIITRAEPDEPPQRSGHHARNEPIPHGRPAPAQESLRDPRAVPGQLLRAHGSAAR